MNHISEIVSYFDFTQTRKSKQYLVTFFSQNQFNQEQTLKTQDRLKVFLDNFEVIERLKINESSVNSFQKLIDEISSEKFTYVKSLAYPEYFKEISNTITLGIDFLYHFATVLRNFKNTENSENFPEEIKKILDFIRTLSVNENYRKVLNFKQKRSFVKTVDQKKIKEEFLEFWHFFYLFDMYASLAKGIKKHRLVFPEFNKDQVFRIDNFYHLEIKDPVKNSVSTVHKNTFIFTGANMSGKSTAMKSLSIVVLLAHLGLAVPADKSTIPYYEKIFMYFSVNDNIQKGYSHFLQEVINLKTVLEEVKKKNCFAVFDEIFNGTNINDSSAITVQSLLGLKQFTNSKFIISTHLNGIENILSEQDNIMIMNLETHLKDGEIIFTYKIKEGWSLLEVGKILFDKYGLSELLKH